MLKWHPLCLAALLCFAACSPAQTPTPAPVIIFPPDPGPPAPTPPSPSAAIRLPADSLYIVQANAPCIVLSSPQGILEIQADAGPMKIMAKIWPSTVVKTVKLTQPYIYVVQATTSGTAELLVIPAGSTDAKSVQRKMIDAGAGPQPPPVPPPTPPAPVDPLTQSIQAALVADGQSMSVAWSLAKLYRTVASTTANDPTILTYAGLFAALKPLQDSQVNPSLIPKLRSVIGQQFTAAFGTNPTMAIDRALVAKTFNAVAAALEGVK